MFRNKKVCPNYERKIAYADLTDSGKGILQQEVINGRVCNGKLLSAEKFEELTDVGIDVGALARFPNTFEFLLTLRDGLYKCGNGALFERISELNFQLPTFLYHPSSDTMLISSRVTSTYAYNKGVLTKVTEQPFDDMATFRDRCFGLSSTTLYFTEQGSVDKWTGQIELPEMAHSLVATNDGLYILGNDVYLLAFDDDEPKSKLLVAYRNLGLIFNKSVQPVGKGFMCLSNSGVQYFNGSGVKNVAAFDVDSCQLASIFSAVCNGKYYVTFCKRNQNNDSVFLSIDVISQKVQTFYDKRPNYLYSAGTELYAVCGSQIFVNGDGYSPVVWRSRPYNFGSDSAAKSFQYLLVDAARDIIVTLRSERETRVIRVQGGKKLHKLPLHGSFHRFTLTVETEGPTDINCIGIAANVYKEVN